MRQYIAGFGTDSIELVKKRGGWGNGVQTQNMYMKNNIYFSFNLFLNNIFKVLKAI